MIKISRLANKVIRKALQRFYGFDKWHVSPLNERPYAQDIISYCNSLKERDYFGEIGCGLGDITRRVNFADRKGYDMDPRVLKAASRLPARGKPAHVAFEKFQFPESALSSRFNILVMVNWIHDIAPDVLKEKLHAYFRDNLLSNGQIIIDSVKDAEYPFHHQIDFLAKGLNCSLYRIGQYARQREVWAIKKTG